MLEKLQKKFTYLCNFDNLRPKFAEGKRDFILNYSSPKGSMEPPA